MTKKSAFYALAVAILMGTMTVVALADNRGMNGCGVTDASISSQDLNQLNAGEIRDPMGTGAIPDPSEDSVVLFLLIIPDTDEEPAAGPLPADRESY